MNCFIQLTLKTFFFEISLVYKPPDAQGQVMSHTVLVHQLSVRDVLILIPHSLINFIEKGLLLGKRS